MSPARIDATGNQVTIWSQGFQQLTVWMGPDAKVDFDKPVKVWVNGRVVAVNRKVQPDLATLLEDCYQRGDRQRPFVAKLDVRP